MEPPLLSKEGIEGRLNRKGQALIIAIFVVAILTAGAVIFSEMVRTDLRAARADLDDLNRLLALKSGLRYAMAILQSHPPGPDALQDDWARLGQEEGWIPVGDAAFRVQIVDASSRLNLNTATPQELKALGLEDNIVDAILDWRDKDASPSPQGAESEYYDSLPVPYPAKNGPFDTVEELLLVKGVTPELLYTAGLPDTLQGGRKLPLIDLLTVRSGEENVTADGKPRININSASAQEMQQKSEGIISQKAAEAIEQYRKNNGTFKSLADLFKVSDVPADEIRQIVDWLTLSEAPILEGRINTNTASPQVLQAVLQPSDESLQAILRRREAQPFQSLGEVAALLEVSQPPSQPNSSARQGAGTPSKPDYTVKLATKSAYFYVRILARMAGRRTIRGAWALVKRTQRKAKILQWREVDRSPGWSAWQWGQAKTTRPGSPEGSPLPQIQDNIP